MDLTKKEILFDIFLKKRIKTFNILKQYLIITLILLYFFYELETKMEINTSDGVLADILI